MFWRVVIGGFVEEIRRRTEHNKAMREAFGHPQLMLVLRAQDGPCPLPERGGGFAQIHGHIKNLTRSDAHQLSLWLLDLIVQTTQHVFGAAAVIVLHKTDRTADGSLESLLVEAFEEEAAFVPKHFGFDQKDFRDGKRSGSHLQ